MMTVLHHPGTAEKGVSDIAPRSALGILGVGGMEREKKGERAEVIRSVRASPNDCRAPPHGEIMKGDIAAKLRLVMGALRSRRLK